MPLYQAQVILPMFTNLPEDVIVNRFHFFAVPDDIDLVGDEIYQQLETFYTTVYGAAVGTRASYINWPAVYCKVFKLDDPTPRIPYTSPAFSFSAGTAVTTIPTEVACVMSFQAAPASGVRYQRLYNRIYLGGIVNSMVEGSSASQYPRFTNTFCNNVGNAAAQLLADGEASGAFWRQVSNATGAAISRDIVGGFVDNGPDTQRRRSVLSNARNPWEPIL